MCYHLFMMRLLSCVSPFTLDHYMFAMECIYDWQKKFDTFTLCGEKYIAFYSQAIPFYPSAIK